LRLVRDALRGFDPLVLRQRLSRLLPLVLWRSAKRGSHEAVGDADQAPRVSDEDSRVVAAEEVCKRRSLFEAQTREL
jgi:hypothetical protein